MHDELIEQIDKLRTKLIVENRKYPKNLYLGTKQMQQLQEYLGYLSGFGIDYFKPKGLSSIRSSFNGMAIYLVDAEDHLSLG